MNTNILVAVIAGAIAWYYYDQQEKTSFKAKDVTIWTMALSGIALLYTSLTSKGRSTETMLAAAAGAASVGFTAPQLLKKEAKET